MPSIMTLPSVNYNQYNTRRLSMHIITRHFKILLLLLLSASKGFFANFFMSSASIVVYLYAFKAQSAVITAWAKLVIFVWRPSCDTIYIYILVKTTPRHTSRHIYIDITHTHTHIYIYVFYGKLNLVQPYLWI